MDTFTCSVTWDGEVHDVEVASPACAALVLEAFLGTRPGLRHLGLALFTAEGTELPADAQVRHGDDLILRPRVVH